MRLSSHLKIIIALLFHLNAISLNAACFAETKLSSAPIPISTYKELVDKDLPPVRIDAWKICDEINTSLKNAILQYNQGNYSKAKILFQDALSRTEQTFKNREDTLKGREAVGVKCVIYCYLAKIISKTKPSAQSESEHYLNLSKDQFFKDGSKMPFIAPTAYTLAQYCKSQNNIVEAQACYCICLDILSRKPQLQEYNNELDPIIEEITSLDKTIYASPSKRDEYLLLSNATDRFSLLSIPLQNVPEMSGVNSGTIWINPDFQSRWLAHLCQLAIFESKTNYPNQTAQNIIQLIQNTSPITPQDSVSNKFIPGLNVLAIYALSRIIQSNISSNFDLAEECRRAICTLCEEEELWKTCCIYPGSTAQFENCSIYREPLIIYKGHGIYFPDICGPPTPPFYGGDLRYNLGGRPIPKMMMNYYPAKREPNSIENYSYDYPTQYSRQIHPSRLLQAILLELADKYKELKHTEQGDELTQIVESQKTKERSVFWQPNQNVPYRNR